MDLNLEINKADLPLICCGRKYRVEEIPELVAAILKKHIPRYKKKIAGLDNAAMEKLIKYSYAYPTEEDLEEVLERGIARCEDELIRVEDLYFGNSPYQEDGRLNLSKYKLFRLLIEKKIFPNFLAIVVLVIFILNWTMLFAMQPYCTWSNFFIWTLGWPALILITVNLGRATCALCPMASVGKLAQKLVRFNKPLPAFFKKYAYLINTFLYVFIFWLEEFFKMHDDPRTSAILILSIVSSAALTFIIFERHTWCSSVCPLGNFISVVAMASPIELRTNHDLCQSKCTYHFCYRGSKKEEGCTLGQHAPYIDNSRDCKLCMNCVHSCPFKSVRINLRVPGAEIPELTYVNRGLFVFLVTVFVMIFPVEYFEHFVRTHISFAEWRIQFSFIYWTTVIFTMVTSWLFIRNKLEDPRHLKLIRILFALSPTMSGLYVAHHIAFIPQPLTPSNMTLVVAELVGFFFTLLILRRIFKDKSYDQKIPE